MKFFDFAIIGGDKRQQYLHQILLEHGYSVICYGITPCFATTASSLKEACHCSKTIIAPIPFSRNKKTLTQLPGESPVFINALLTLLSPDYTMIAGMIPPIFSAHCHCIDLMKQASFVTANSIVTAEVATATAILHMPDKLYGCPCLVTGYGHCAKALAHCLSQLHANVSITARSPSALYEAEQDGFCAINLSKLTPYLASFSIIFNTIPAPIFCKERIMECQPCTLYLELASSPGGLACLPLAKEQLYLLPCQELPGRSSPLPCAKAIFEQISNL